MSKTRMSQALITVMVLWLTLGLTLSSCDSEEKGPPDTSPDGLKNMAPTEPGAGGGSGSANMDGEPNNTIEEASELPSTEEAAQYNGTLTGGLADTDVYLVPPAMGPGAVQISVAPRNEGDVMLGVVSRRGKDPLWIDSEVGGGTETVPNVGVGSQGSWVFVRARGEADVPYRLEVVKRSAEVLTEAEPNDDPSMAQELGVGVSLTAYVNRSGDVDHFRLRPTSQEEPLDITISPPGKRTLEVRLSADGSMVWRNLIEDGTPVTFRGLKPRADGYELVVEMVGELDRPQVYQVALGQGGAEGLVELEPNDVLEEAQPIEVLGTPLAAAFHQATDVDFYKTAIPAPPSMAPRVMSVKVQPDPDVDPQLEVHLVEAGQRLQRSAAGPGEPEAICNLPYTGATTAEIKVLPNPAVAPPGDAPYSLLVETRAAEGEELEPNDDGRLNPTVLTPGSGIKGFIHPAADVDVYRFSVPTRSGDLTARASTTIKVAPGYKANLSLQLKDAQLADVASIDDTGFGEGETRQVDLPAGDYFLEVRSSGGASCSSPYLLSVQLPPDWAAPSGGGTGDPFGGGTQGGTDPDQGTGDDGAGGDGADGDGVNSGEGELDPPDTLGDEEDPPLKLPTGSGGDGPGDDGF